MKKKKEEQIHKFAFVLRFQSKSTVLMPTKGAGGGEKKASLTVLAFIQGTLRSLMPRFRHKEKHVFLKNSCQIGWQIPRACLAHLLVLAMGVARSAHVK